MIVNGMNHRNMFFNIHILYFDTMEWKKSKINTPFVTGYTKSFLMNETINFLGNISKNKIFTTINKDTIFTTSKMDTIFIIQFVKQLKQIPFVQDKNCARIMKLFL